MCRFFSLRTVVTRVGSRCPRVTAATPVVYAAMAVVQVLPLYSPRLPVFSCSSFPEQVGEGVLECLRGGASYSNLLISCRFRLSADRSRTWCVPLLTLPHASCTPLLPIPYGEWEMPDHQWRSMGVRTGRTLYLARSVHLGLYNTPPFISSVCCRPHHNVSHNAFAFPKNCNPRRYISFSYPYSSSGMDPLAVVPIHYVPHYISETSLAYVAISICTEWEWIQVESLVAVVDGWCLLESD